MKISESVHKFLIYLEIEKQKSKKTLENYQHYLNRFQQFLNDDVQIESINLNKIQEYRLFLNRIKIQSFGLALFLY
jgi:site-specific recombinase XerD